MPDSVLYMLDEDFLGLVENLDDISDSSDDDNSSSDDEAPSKKRKPWVKPSDGNQKKRAKDGGDMMGREEGEGKRGGERHFQSGEQWRQELGVHEGETNIEHLWTHKAWEHREDQEWPGDEEVKRGD